jgi:hypothetical protein
MKSLSWFGLVLAVANSYFLLYETKFSMSSVLSLGLIIVCLELFHIFRNESKEQVQNRIDNDEN